MRIFSDVLRLLFRSKILISAMFLTVVFLIWDISRWYGPDQGAVQPLSHAMTLSIYLYIIMMYISFEFFRKFHNNGVEEAVLVTSRGKKDKQGRAAFLVLTLYSLLVSLIIMGLVIWEFLFFQIKDPDHEYVFHIIKNILVNDFLIMELSIITGFALSTMKHRLFPYTIITFLGIMVSPFANTVAYLIYAGSSVSVGKKAYDVLAVFNVMPKINMKFQTLAEFGESILPYRFFIIGFWLFLFLFFLCLKKKYYKRFMMIPAVICIICLAGYLYPSSKVILDFDPNSSGSYDDAHYFFSKEEKAKKEAALFSITSYKMNLGIRLNLTAEVDMQLSDSLDEYKMTLYHCYKVLSAKDQDGETLNFEQNGDYILVKNPDHKEITNIIMKYRGSAPAYYANYQGCYLPAYFAYYPRAGYLPLYSEEYQAMDNAFVPEDTYFEVKVNSNRTYISNLTEKDGVYRGKCDGFTIVSGFYKIKNLGNGNKLVYPYLDNFVLHDGKTSESEAWKENFESSARELRKDGRADTMIFAMPAMNQHISIRYGKNQVFSCGSFYFSEV